MTEIEQTQIVLSFLNAWYSILGNNLEFPGVAFGISACLAWMYREKYIARYFTLITFISFVFEPLFLLSMPHFEIMRGISNVDFTNNIFILRIFFLDAVISALIVFWVIRAASHLIEFLRTAFTSKTNIERDCKTDIRQMSNYLPNPQKQYDPSSYFDFKKGIFLGLDESHSPIYVPIPHWRKSNVDISGHTGSGKGVIAGVLTTQALWNGDAVVIISPKEDEYLPHILYQAALKAGVPYIYVDLTSEQAQWNPLQGKSKLEIEELFSSAFSMAERGTDADYYRLDDRKAARAVANLPEKQRATLAQALSHTLSEQPDLAKSAKKFIADMDEICTLGAVNVEHGIDIPTLIEQGAVIYVRGTIRNPRILKLQRMFLISMIQHIESRNRQNARHVCLLAEEVKYMLSKGLVEALGTIRDKKCNVLVSHQSLGDLKDCPGDLNAESVAAAVLQNCTLKIVYQPKDPETRDWFASLSGEIQVDDESREIRTNAGLAEVSDGERTLRQSTRHLIDKNMLQSLPDRCAALFGFGLTKLFFTSHIIVEKYELATTPVKFETRQSEPPSSASGLLDVD